MRLPDDAVSDELVVESAETTAVLTDGLPETDMDGFVLTILHHDQDNLTWVDHQLMSEAENGDIVNDAIFKQNREIEERFNAELNIVELPSPASAMVSAVLAGEETYDIVLQHGSNIISNIQYISDFGQLEYIDFEGAHWNPDATDMFHIAGKRIAAAGNYVLAYLTGTSCTMFNKDMYTDLGISDDIYRLVLDGKWTVDKYRYPARSTCVPFTVQPA